MAKNTGIRTRHGRACASRSGRVCNCNPSYEAWVYSARDRRKLRHTLPDVAAAKGWRHDAASAVRKGTMTVPTRLTLGRGGRGVACGRESGCGPHARGLAVKPAVLRGYEADLRRYVLPDLGTQGPGALRRAYLQALVDRLVETVARPAKIHSVLMPVRALCRHAIERDGLLVNPTTNLRLPVADGRRERAASVRGVRRADRGTAWKRLQRLWCNRGRGWPPTRRAARARSRAMSTSRP